jgi:hypothetical protein
MSYLKACYDGLEEVLKGNPEARWIFLTFTVRNCPMEELRATITQMNRAWNRLQLLTDWGKRVKGAIKTTETTFGNNATAHPHFHIICHLANDYFTRSDLYYQQNDWSILWKNALKANYVPICHVTAVKHSDSQRALRELIKTIGYSIKPDCMADPDMAPLFKEYDAQTHGLRSISCTGSLKRKICLNGQRRGKQVHYPTRDDDRYSYNINEETYEKQQHSSDMQPRHDFANNGGQAVPAYPQ